MVTSTIVVNIVDDVPKANADTASVGEGGDVTGNVLANDDGGADGPAAGGGVVGVRAGSDTSTPVVGGLNSQINGTYGYLTLDAHGNAEYHSYPNSVNGPGATDTFTYTLRDGDGDQSTTTLTIDVNNSCIKAGQRQRRDRLRKSPRLTPRTARTWRPATPPAAIPITRARPPAARWSARSPAPAARSATAWSAALRAISG